MSGPKRREDFGSHLIVVLRDRPIREAPARRSQAGVCRTVPPPASGSFSVRVSWPQWRGSRPASPVWRMLLRLAAAARERAGPGTRAPGIGAWSARLTTGSAATASPRAPAGAAGRPGPQWRLQAPVKPEWTLRTGWGGLKVGQRMEGRPPGVLAEGPPCAWKSRTHGLEGLGGGGRGAAARKD